MTKRDLLLWTPILLPPVAWFLGLEANFALAPIPCNTGVMLARALVWLVAFLIAAADALLALSLWRRATGPETAQSAAAERDRDMAFSGIVLSAGFGLVIVAQSIPLWFLSGCS